MYRIYLYNSYNYPIFIYSVSCQSVVTRDLLGSDGPSWPYDGPVGEKISAKGIPGLVCTYIA